MRPSVRLRVMTHPSKRDLLAKGRLSQRCPKCGTVEAAGHYCSKCFTPTGEDDWFGRDTTPALTALRRAKRS